VLFAQPENQSQIGDIVRTSQVELVPCLASNDDVLRPAPHVVLVRPGDGVFALVQVLDGRHVLDLEVHVAIDRHIVEFSRDSLFDRLRCLVISDYVAIEVLAGVLEAGVVGLELNK
jgi:hypothetical protein